MKQSFNIESYTIEGDNIVVMCEKWNRGVPVTIPKHLFETFLLGQDKLDWELNSSDERGEHVQKTGRMTIEEYWEGDMAYIYQDLYEYIVFHPITFRGELISDSRISIVNSLMLKL